MSSSREALRFRAPQRLAFASPGGLVRAALALLLAACGGKDGGGGVGPVTPVATTLALAPDSVVLASLGDTAAFTAQVLDQDGAPMGASTVTWSVAPAAVATSLGGGRVQAVGNGRATVVASAGTTAALSKSVVLVVQQRPVAVLITGDGQTAVAGSTLAAPLGVKVVDARGNGVPGVTVRWSATAGTLASPTSVTDATGTATVGYTLGDAAGPQAVSATIEGAALSPVSFTANALARLVARDDAYPFGVTGNVAMNTAQLPTPFSVTAGDELAADATVSFAGWQATAGRSEHGGTVSVVASGAARGQFTYDPPAGYEGADRFTYTVTQGAQTASATVTLTVSGMLWFVDAAATACTTRATGCGRLSSPYSALSALEIENTGVGDNPAPGDAIFLFERAATYAGPLHLLPGQRLVGQDASAPLASILGLTLAPGSASLPATDASNAARVVVAGDGVVVSSGNTVRGLRVAATGGVALQGLNIGTLTVGDLELASVNGKTIDLANGTLAGEFRRVDATASAANAVTLANVTGPFTVTGTGAAGTGGTIESSAGIGLSLANAGPVSLRWMTLRGNAGGAVKGRTVAGFVLARSDVQDNGAAAGIDALDFLALTGVARLDTVSFTGSRRRHVTVVDSSGTLDLRVTGSTFVGTSAIDGGDAFYVEPDGTATVDLAIDGASFSGSAGFHVHYEAGDAAGGRFTLRNSTFARGTAPTAALQGVIFGGRSAVPGWRGAITYDVASNTFSGTRGAAVIAALGISAATGTMTGFVRDNQVGGTEVRSCSLGDAGIIVAGQGNGRHVAAVTNNVLQHCGNAGIRLIGGQGAGTFEATVTGNQEIATDAGQGVKLELGTAGANVYGGTDATTMCLALGDAGDAARRNVLTAGGSFSDDVAVFQQPGTTLRLPGYTGAANDGTAVIAYFATRNVKPSGAPVTGTASGVNAVGATGCATP